MSWPPDDFPWLDPADTGYEVEPYDPETDEAPRGHGGGVCAGEAHDGDG